MLYLLSFIPEAQNLCILLYNLKFKYITGRIIYRIDRFKMLIFSFLMIIRNYFTFTENHFITYPPIPQNLLTCFPLYIKLFRVPSYLEFIYYKYNNSNFVLISSWKASFPNWSRFLKHWWYSSFSPRKASTRPSTGAHRATKT